MSFMPMTRRDAVIRMAILMGASVVGPRLLARNFGLAATLDFSPDEIGLLDEIGETIIPATDSPGAKSVGIGGFIAMMVADCYAAPAQAAFKAGLGRLSQDYKTRFGEEFIGGQPANRSQFLDELETEQREYTAGQGIQERKDLPHYFRMLRELTVIGYFTSKEGSAQAGQYLEVPGRYDGNVPYKKGDPYFV